MNRRDFLKYIGAGAATATLAACGSATDSDTRREPKGKMTYRVNHNTGDSVSILGYGCMRLPILENQPEGEEPVYDQEEVNRQVDYALEHGINYFDTSPAYCKGQSESVMGKALSRHPRSSYYIATKLSNFAPLTWPREKSIEMFENSLKNLRTDYIDYMLLHAIGGGGMDRVRERYIDNGILDYLVEQRANGRVRNLGFSFHGDIDVYDTMLRWHDEGKVHWDFVQIQLNYMDWNVEKTVENRNVDAEYLYNELRRRDIPAVVMEPLLGGALASMGNNAARLLKERRPDDSLASWAFRFAATPEGILTVLSGMTLMDHLVDNTITYSPLEPITPDEDKALRQVADILRQHPTVPCTGCQYCMPCPWGVDIPTIFKHYNKCVKEQGIIDDPTDKGYTAARRAFLIGYDRAVEKLRQASHCIGCGMCVSHCPQEINIPERLHSIDDYAETLRRNA